MLTEPLAATTQVVEVLESLDIPYFNWAYLRRWAAQLKLSDLLERVESEDRF